MIGFEIKNGYIDFAKTDFKCPYCGKEYIDEGKYSTRCNNNKDRCTRIKCKCGKSFKVTYSERGDIVTFY